MRRYIVCVMLLLGLVPGAALAKTFCVQLDDNGDVLVLKRVGKGSKALSAYIAKFTGGDPLFNFRPLTGSSIMMGEKLVAGLTEYGIHLSAPVGDGFSEETVFHRLICRPGPDGKLGVLDSCTDTTWRLPVEAQTGRPAHIIDCIPEVAIP